MRWACVQLALLAGMVYVIGWQLVPAAEDLERYVGRLLALAALVFAYYGASYAEGRAVERRRWRARQRTAQAALPAGFRLAYRYDRGGPRNPDVLTVAAIPDGDTDLGRAQWRFALVVSPWSDVGPHEVDLRAGPGAWVTRAAIDVIGALAAARPAHLAAAMLVLDRLGAVQVRLRRFGYDVQRRLHSDPERRWMSMIGGRQTAAIDGSSGGLLAQLAEAAGLRNFDEAGAAYDVRVAVWDNPDADMEAEPESAREVYGKAPAGAGRGEPPPVCVLDVEDPDARRRHVLEHGCVAFSPTWPCPSLARQRHGE